MSESVRETIDKITAASKSTEETEETAAEETTDLPETEANSDNQDEANETDDTGDINDSNDPNTAESGEDAEPLEPIDAPVSWDKEAKEEFGKLPRHLQEKVAEREKQRESYLTQKSTEAARQIEEATSKAKNYHELDRLFEGKESKYLLHGTSKAQVVGQLLAAQEYLDSNPVEALNWIAQSYGLTFDQLAQLQADGNKQADPELIRLKQQLAQQENQMQGFMSQQQQIMTSAQLNAMNAVVENFKNEADASGKLTRPYFKDAEPTMMPIVQQLKSQNPNENPYKILEAAYEQALWINPELRQKLVDKQIQEKIAAQTDREKIRVQKAKQAGVSVSGAPSGNPSSNGARKGESVGETIARIKREASARIT